MEQAFHRRRRRRAIVWDDGDQEDDHEDHALCSLQILTPSSLPQRVAIILDNPVVPDKIAENHSWNNSDRSYNIYLVDHDPLTMRRYPVAQSTDCIRGKVGYTTGIHCWEVTWEVGQRGTHAMVGVATKEQVLSGEGYQNLVGNTEHSWGWDLVRNKAYHRGVGQRYPISREYCRHWTLPDTFNMVLDMDNGKLGFVIENHFLGWSHHNVKTGREVFPIVNTVWGNCEVKMRYQGSLEWEDMGLQIFAKAAIRSALGRNSKDLNKKVETLQLPRILKNCLKNQEKSGNKQNNNP